MSQDSSLEKWKESASAWIESQGEEGDWSRREILDPALEKILVDLKGRMILDLGCGEGRYSRILNAKGALVSGVDPVPKFIEKARSLDSESDYQVGTAEDLPFSNASFHLVLSYLSIIDIADLEKAAEEITRVLRSNGELIIVTISNLASTTPGWTKDEEGNKLYRKVDRYMEHFSMDLEWNGIKIRNYHRPLSYILGLFLDRGFVLTKFLEPLPPSSDSGFEKEMRVPNFQIYSLEKSS